MSGTDFLTLFGWVMCEGTGVSGSVSAGGGGGDGGATCVDGDGGGGCGGEGCRVPIPWQAEAPAYGFNTTGASWLPQPAEYREKSRDLQEGRAGSTLELYRRALSVRRAHALGHGSLEWLDGYGDDVVAYCRSGERSSHTWFVLTYLLGFDTVRNYDGSWTEWGNAVRVPIVQGEERG